MPTGLETLPAMSDDEFTDYVEALSEVESYVTKKATEILLYAMESSGIQDDGESLLLWWPEEHEAIHRGITVLKEQYSGTTPWATVLQDSEFCAVFAMATTRCLEHHEVKICRNAPTFAFWEDIRDVVLDTALVLTSVRGTPSYKEGNKYLIWQRSEILRVTRAASVTDDVVRLTMDKHLMPPTILRFLQKKWTTVRGREVTDAKAQQVLLL